MVILRNVPISLSDEEIKTELISKSLLIQKITRLLNKDKIPMPLVVVELTNNDEATEIFNLTNLLYSIISVEPRKKSRDTPQCTNCQRYGHTKNYGKLEPRCVKCS